MNDGGSYVGLFVSVLQFWHCMDAYPLFSFISHDLSCTTACVCMFFVFWWLFEVNLTVPHPLKPHCNGFIQPCDVERRFNCGKHGRRLSSSVGYKEQILTLQPLSHCFSPSLFFLPLHSIAVLFSLFSPFGVGGLSHRCVPFVASPFPRITACSQSDK